jgi:hypothetical protein
MLASSEPFGYNIGKNLGIRSELLALLATSGDLIVIANFTYPTISGRTRCLNDSHFIIFSARVLPVRADSCDGIDYSPSLFPSIECFVDEQGSIGGVGTDP